MSRRPPSEKSAAERRQLPRYRVRCEADVKLKTLGSLSPYAFQTANISNGGIYVMTGAAYHPFREKTLVEVWLTLPDANPAPLYCMAKVIHLKDGVGFGAAIIQIEDATQDRLTAFLEEYERNHPNSRI